MQKAGRTRKYGLLACIQGFISEKRMAVSGWTSPPDAFFHVSLGSSVSFLTKACTGW